LAESGIGGAEQDEENGMMAWRHDGKGRQAAWRSHDLCVGSEKAD